LPPSSANVAKNAARSVYGRILGTTPLEWKELKGRKVAEPKHRKVAPDHDDIQTWLKLMKGVKQIRTEVYLMWSLLYEAALRKQDLVDVPFTVSKRTPNMVYSGSWSQGKTERDRTAFMTPALYEEIAAWKETQVPNERMFPYTNNSVKQMLFRSEKQMQVLYPSLLRNMGPHLMRHARITYLVIVVGMSRETVRDLVGHASLKTTSLYINPAAGITQ
jgi:integrase